MYKNKEEAAPTVFLSFSSSLRTSQPLVHRCMHTAARLITLFVYSGPRLWRILFKKKNTGKRIYFKKNLLSLVVTLTHRDLCECLFV